LLSKRFWLAFFALDARVPRQSRAQTRRAGGATYSVFTFLMVSSEGPVGALAAVSIMTCSFSSASS